MKLKKINPWKYQKAYSISHAIEVTGAQRILYCTGQTAVNEDGEPVFGDDMVAQMEHALNNLEIVLAESGMALENVVRLNCFTTDIAKYNLASKVLISRLEAENCQPASCLIEVAGLFHPDVLIELEATAVA